MQRLLDRIFKPGSNYKLFIFFITVGFLLNIPYIFNGFNYDDFMFVSMLEEKIPYNHYTGFWSVEFKDFRAFNSLWWYEPGADGNFLRPVPTALLSVMYDMFGRNASYPLHILSILMHGAVGFTVFLLFFRMSKKYAVSLLAGFIYLVCEDNTYTISWIATNTDILAVLFINVSFINYISFREKKKAVNFILFVLTMVTGLLCKETAVVLPLGILLYEFILTPVEENEKISFGKRFSMLFANTKFWISSVVILIIYLIIYKTQGFGTNNLLYYDPFSQTGTYLKNLLPGFLLMFNGVLTPLPFTLAIFIPMLKYAFLFIGAVAIILFIIVLYPQRKDKMVQLCFIMLVLSLFPQLSVDATERQMYYPFLFAAYLISFLIFRLNFLGKRAEPETEALSKNTLTEKITGWYFIVTAVILAFILSFIYPFTYVQSMSSPGKYIKQTIPFIQQSNAEKIFYLNTQGIFMTFYAPDITRYYLGYYKDLHILSSFNGRVWVKKNSDSSFSIKTDWMPLKSGAEGWLGNMFARLVRLTPKFEKGRVYDKQFVRAEIINITDDKKDVLEVKFDFKHSLYVKGVIFLYFDGERFNQWDFRTNKPDEWYFLGDTSDFMKGMM